MFGDLRDVVGVGGWEGGGGGTKQKKPLSVGSGADAYKQISLRLVW